MYLIFTRNVRLSHVAIHLPKWFLIWSFRHNRLEDQPEPDQTRSDHHYDRAAPKCGTPSNDRIVGGQETKKGEFPWAVALELSWGFQFCGGSLINERVSGLPTWYVGLSLTMMQYLWDRSLSHCSLLQLQFVLTASHCLSWGKDVLKSRVLIGGYNLDNQGQDGSIYRNIKRIKLHIKYNSSTTDYDVALVSYSGNCSL